MFAHIYTHRLKCLLGDRSSLFWSLLFPLILATFFKLGLSSVDQIDAFSQIPVAVVDNAAYRQDDSLRQALTDVSKKQSDGTQALFKVQTLTEEQADQALKDGKISGYLVPGEGENGLEVVLKDDGTDQTILKTFADQYIQTTAAYKDIAAADPAAMRTAVSVKTQEFLRSVPIAKNVPKESTTYFYALIAMACLYGGFWGLKEITAVQANQSMQGARVNLAPVHKVRVFAASLCAALTVQTAGVLLLIGYLQFGLQVQIAAQLGYILLTGFAGSLAGVMLGAVIGSLIVARPGSSRDGIVSMVSLSLSFLAGMMYDKMKYIVATHVPPLSYINPASLIADSLYSLYYFDTHTRYFTDIGILFALSAAGFAVVYFTLRRQKYESI